MQHEENLNRIRNMSHTKTNTACPAANWLQEQLSEHDDTNLSETVEVDRRQRLLNDLQKQQQDLQQQIGDVMGSANSNPPSKSKTDQELLLEQIRTALTPKESDRDPNRALLKALMTAQNKAPGCSGTSTLKLEMVNRLTGQTEFSMAEWLASLNKQEEGESEVTKLLSKLDDEYDCRNECRHSKMKSGMLDKSTTNIRHKEIWPQKNLGEDWAEEEIEFKQLRFEYLVAGETRTIETCTDPAQILGRLRLL